LSATRTCLKLNPPSQARSALGSRNRWRDCHSSTAPDTRTPGFDAENLRKPPETAAISGKSVAPEVVAAALARGIERNADNIAVDALTKLLLPLGGVIEPLARGGLRKQIAKALR
jgi:3-dehydrosphinganine reductase